MTFADFSHRARRRHVLTIVATLLFGLVLLRTAWISDDAFITLRTLDNVVNGYGLRWNIAERVQSFTHPAWLLMLLPAYAITREPYFTVLVLQIALSLTMFVTMCRSVALGWPQVVFVAAMCLSSKALVDFSTSGLENPLTHLSLVLTFLIWRAPATSRRITALMATSCVALLCRQDLVLLLAPAVAFAVLGQRPWPIRAAMIGALPLLAWETFSLVYYGSFVPNTALAKLSTGIPVASLLRQGEAYWAATYFFDPVTPVVVVATAFVLALWYGSQGRLISAGMTIYGVYLLRAGGDFMTGRFFTPLLVWGVLGVAGLRVVRPVIADFVLPVAAIGLFAGGMVFTGTPPLLSGPGFGLDQGLEQEFERYGVADERRFYFPMTGLIRRSGVGGPLASTPWAQAGERLRTRGGATSVVQAKNVGFFGYYAGPRVHVIDLYALGDPLLARLPALPNWRIGHYARRPPDGYVETWMTGVNALRDPGISQLYDRIATVTQGPLWRRTRWRSIAQLTFHPRTFK